MEHKIFVSVQGEWRRFAKRLCLLESWSRFLTSTTSLRIPKENSPCGLQNSESTGQRTMRNGAAVRTIVPVGSREQPLSILTGIPAQDLPCQ